VDLEYSGGEGAMTPHWPKEGDDLGPFEIFDFEKEKFQEEKPSEGIKTLVKSPTFSFSLSSKLRSPSPASSSSRRKVSSKIQNNILKLSTPISSSEEHFDEVKEEVKEILSVLTNTKVTPSFPPDVYPTQVSLGGGGGGGTADDDVDPLEGIDLSSIVLDDIELNGPDGIHNNQMGSKIPVSHLPTPPLDLKLETYSKKQNNNDDDLGQRTKVTTASSSSTTTPKYKLPSKNSQRIPDDMTQLDLLFPEIGNLDSHKKAASSSHSAVIIDFPTDILGERPLRIRIILQSRLMKKKVMTLGRNLHPFWLSEREQFSLITSLQKVLQFGLNFWFLPFRLRRLLISFPHL